MMKTIWKHDENSCETWLEGRLKKVKKVLEIAHFCKCAYNVL